MKLYDLRSDTVTLQSEEMKKAMYLAEVGDDVFSEDKTINKLEDKAKELSGKEASLFVSSGCMANLLTLLVKGGKGKEVLCAPESHIIGHEIGAVSAFANTMPIVIPSVNGLIDETKVQAYIKDRDYLSAESAILEIENTTGGIVYPLDKIKKLREIAIKNNMFTHLDGARIFNAVVETGISLSQYASFADSITFCLSKGLGAPVGSVLSGDKEFISLARRYRKMIGGGMRQAGYLAAAGIYALDNNIQRLKIDHNNAKMIKETLDELDWAEVITYGTNMIFFKVENRDLVLAKLREKGILALNEGNLIRFVTNMNVSEKDTLEIINIIKTLEV